MKKQTLLLLTGGLLTFAACNNNTNQNASQAEIDSMVNVKVAELQVQMQAKNDSIINALAQVKADSMVAAMNGGVHTSSASKGTSKGHTGTTKPETNKPETNPNNVNNRPGASNQGSKNVNDRPGAANNNTGQPGSVNNRPGAY